MKLVAARALRIPEPAIRPVVVRDVYPPPRVVRAAPPPPAPAVQPRAVPPAQPARAPIPEAMLRRAIRQEMREMNLERHVPVRENVQERYQDRTQDRVQERIQAPGPQRLEPMEPQGLPFANDPWDDGFGDDPVPGAVPPEASQSGTVVSSSPTGAPMVVAPSGSGYGPNGQVSPGSVGVPQTAIVVSDGYGPLAQMSRRLRIQAAEGYRAGVIRLKNGMYLVVEIAQEALEPEFGVAPMLAPLVFNVAAKALEDPEAQKALMNVASHGVDAVGRGIQQLTHRPQQRRHPARANHPAPRPAAQAVMAPAPGPAYNPWSNYFVPPGYVLVPQNRIPVAPPPQMQRQQPTQVALRQEALPWADDQDFAGLFDEGAELYSW